MYRIVEVLLPTPYKEEQIINAVLAIALRYPPLRAYFLCIEGKWRQFIKRVLKNGDIRIGIYDTGNYENDKEIFYRSLGNDIDIKTPPLFRTGIVSQSEKIYFVLIIHEIIAQSIDIDGSVIPDFLKAYSGDPSGFWRKADFPLVNLTEQDFTKILLNAEDIYPLSAVQMGMISFSLSRAKQHPFERITPIAFQDLSYDHSAFEKALNLIIDKHEILRARFLKRFTCQVIIRHNYLNLEVMDLSELTGDEQRRRILNEVQSIYEEGYNFKGGEMFRVRLYKLNNHIYQFVIFNHLCILDGWSMSLFRDELFSLYTMCKKEKSISNGILESSYRDYVLYEQKMLLDKEAKIFWDEMLGNNESTIAPVGLPGNDYQENYVEWLEIPLTQLVIHFSKTRQTSAKNIFLAALFYFIHLLSQKRTVILSVISHGRPPLPDSEKVLGCFINTVPYRIDLDCGDDLASIITKINDLSIGVKQYENYPLAKTTELLFSFVSFKNLSDIQTDVRFVDPVIDSSGLLNNKFHLNVKNKDNGYLINLECEKQKYTFESLKLMIKYYKFILDCLCSERDPSEIKTILADDPQWQLLSRLQKETVLSNTAPSNQ